MRILVLLLLVPAAAAQPRLFPDGSGPARTAAPHWQISAGGGLSGQLTGVASLGLERTVAGPFSVGARGVLYTSGSFFDDGDRFEGVSVDVTGSVGTRDRVADLRAFAGVGVSAVERSSSGFGEFQAATTGERLLGPHLVGGLGLDVYPLAGVGVGIEARGVLAPLFGADLSTVTAGLRVRLAK